jgi:GDP-L-fucose synthase
MKIKKNDKIFLAGHRGFVGSAIYQKLKIEGFKKVVTVDKKNLNLLDQKNTFRFIKKHKPKLVIICAAKVGGIKANINYGADFIYENLQVQNNLIYGSYVNGVKKLIFLGSSCVYPKNFKRKIKETDLLSGNLEETNEPYAIAKIAGVKMCQAFNKQYATQYLTLMPCNVYGPGDNYDLEKSHFLAAILKKIYDNKIQNSKVIKLWGTGVAKRELLFSEDLADAVIHFIKKNKVNHSLINIGSKNELSIKFYVKKILKILNIEMRVQFDGNKSLDGTLRKKLDVSLAKKYGWEEKTSFKEGILKSYNSLNK